MRFTKDHEWVALDGDIAALGITAYASDQLGDVVFVELPDIGKVLKPGDSFAVVESVKAASDVYCPVAGEVVAVNDDVVGSPELIGESPEDLAWLAKVRVSDKAAVEALMDRAAYEAYLRGL